MDDNTGEKHGWLGDALDATPMTMLNYYVPAVYAPHTHLHGGGETGDSVCSRGIFCMACHGDPPHACRTVLLVTYYNNF